MIISNALGVTDMVIEKADCIVNIRPNNYFGRGLCAPQIEQNVQCFNCNAYGHMARFCRNTFTSSRWQDNIFHQP